MPYPQIEMASYGAMSVLILINDRFYSSLPSIFSEVRAEKQGLPNMMFVDCDSIGLVAELHNRCMKIKFEGSNTTTEYAGLDMVDGEQSVLEGPLYDIDLKMKDGASMMLDIGDDGNNCSVSWTGEGGVFTIYIYFLFITGNHF